MGEKQPRLTAKEVEKLLFQNGFIFYRQKGSHKIYVKLEKKVTSPFHSGKILHPKIIKEVLNIIKD